MKNYSIKHSGSSKIAAALSTQLSQGKAGDILITAGFSQENFCTFLARLAIRAVKQGYDDKKLTDLFKQMAAGNASQARQALADVSITIDGGKETSLGIHWGKTDASPAIDVSALADL